ncbi:MAG: dynamin family protein [Proteobacteria bacterium]|nr:dynamin family protein [Pseudomonadota bacterium]
MTPNFAERLDALAVWRGALARRVDEVARFLADHELADPASTAQLDGLRERLGSEQLVVAFVAEFSRGKSELINAVFFADTGRRILPATPGRTTMCPVELAWQADEPPQLSLLPIDTRREGLSLGELRLQRRAWTVRPLDVGHPERLAEAMQEVTATRRVTVAEARALGFWHDAATDDNPMPDATGRVEIPAWRHALINYPHPLLKQGLVVLDTPGLNALGAEPELTLSLLPHAHATLFVLGADTGVTKSDYAIWRDHLGSPAMTRFVVLNKIDALIDPLARPEQVEAQISSQCAGTAVTLGVEPDRVFPISARQALAARIAGDAAGLAQSRLPELEQALAGQLLPQRRAVLANVVHDAARQIDGHVARRLSDQRRQMAEQMLELRGLRGKSSGKLRLMLQRIENDGAEFEECATRLQALRSVHARMLRDALAVVSGERLREEVHQGLQAMTASLLNLGARKAFAALCARLQAQLAEAQRRAVEIREMLAGSFARLNAEFGFSLQTVSGPELERFIDDLAAFEQGCMKYLGLVQAMRLSNAPAMEQFRRLLMTRLRNIFEGASGEVDLWSRQVSAQIEAQLRERRRGFARRREAVERIQTAASELELRIAEIEAQDQRLQQFLGRARDLTEGLRTHADIEVATDERREAVQA